MLKQANIQFRESYIAVEFDGSSVISLSGYLFLTNRHQIYFIRLRAQPKILIRLSCRIPFLSFCYRSQQYLYHYNYQIVNIILIHYYFKFLYICPWSSNQPHFVLQFSICSPTLVERPYSDGRSIGHSLAQFSSSNFHSLFLYSGRP